MESCSFVAIVTAVLSVVSLFLGTKYRKWLERGRLFAEDALQIMLFVTVTYIVLYVAKR
jgi:hypothetical protein